MIGHDTAAKAGFGMEVVSHRLTVSAHLRFHAMTISHFVSDLAGNFSRTPFASVAKICKMPANLSGPLRHVLLRQDSEEDVMEPTSSRRRQHPEMSLE